MSDTGFFLLPTNKLYKKENTKRLKNFPAGYVGSFYRKYKNNKRLYEVIEYFSRLLHYH